MVVLKLPMLVNDISEQVPDTINRYFPVAIG